MNRKGFGWVVLTAIALLSPAVEAADLPVATYRIRHTLEITGIPPGTRELRVWFWVPDEDEAQKILDLRVTQAPAGYRITRDPAGGHRYLFATYQNPSASVSLATEFLLRRRAVHVDLDPALCGALTDEHRAEFAEYLRTDVPNMSVTPELRALADRICGPESNVVREARLLYDFVAANTRHYSIPGAPKASGQGSAEYCLAKKGGSCSDQHALFIALARARGIPTRLEFGCSLKPANEGKAVEPGYHCWVLYFVPKYGWTPMDISAATIDPGKRDFYFSGLDERRVHFLEGRDLELCPPQQGGRVNMMIGAYAEADGKPLAAGLSRKLECHRVDDPAGR